MMQDHSGPDRRHLRWIAAALLLLLLFSIAPAAADTGTTVMPSNKDTLLSISNNETARFNDYGNNTYHFFSPTQSATQGLNALHITTDPASSSGQVTFSTDQSGVFYLTDTGGRGWDDDGILMLAVNGTIPDDFQVSIKASGYQWAPVLTGTYPAFSSVTYVADALNETFTKDDFLYGPQIWRPCPAADYPIFDGQDMANAGNNFSVMFIDLNAGILGAGTLSQSDFSGQSINDNGAIRVGYSFENLETFAAFDAYAYTVSSNQGQGVRWTNRLSADGASGYAVTSAPASAAPVADFTAMPTSGDAPLTVEFTDLSANSPTAWSWDFGDNETSTEQNPTHVYTTAGAYTVTLTASNIDGSDSAAKADYITVTGSSVLPAYNYIFVKVANDGGVKYNSYLNNTYNIRFAGAGRGLNAHHITTDPVPAPYGQVTATTNRSGVFYVTDTGGSGFADNVVLMIAANGTIPDDFRIHICTSGYNWTPMAGLEEIPPQSAINYVEGAVDETFTKEDFIYGPQTWKPSGETTPYPIYEGQNMSNAADTFRCMFVDVYVGQLGTNSGMSGLNNAGAAKVEYTIENMPASVVFNSYCWNSNANQGPSVIAWTNNLIGGHNGNSGYAVISDGSGPELSRIEVSPSSATLTAGDGVQFNATAYDPSGTPIEGITFTWTSSDDTVGTVNATGYFTSLTYGRVDVTAAVGAVNGTSSVTVNPTSPVTWSVNASGGGDFTTIQAAIDAAFDGDTIVVGDGTYNETLAIAKPLTLRSANGPEKTEIVSTSKYHVTVSADNTTVSGFGIGGSGTYGIYSKGYSGCTFADNIISKKVGIQIVSGSTMLVEGNTVTGVPASSTGIYLSATTGSTIGNNTCLGGGIGSYGIEMHSGTNNVLTGNTVTGYTFAFNLESGSRIDHNLVMDNTYISWGGIDTIRDNIIYANSFVNNSYIFGGGLQVANTWNSTVPMTYIYNGATYTDYIGNYWGAMYPIDDADGNGIGDAGVYMPFSMLYLYTGNVDNHPLVLPAEAYFGESYDGIPIPTTVEIAPSSIVLPGETTQQYTGTVYDQNGKPMRGAGFAWTSSDEQVGSVLGGPTRVSTATTVFYVEYGDTTTFTGEYAGTTTITARSYLVKGTAEAVVNTTVLETVWTDPCESTDGWTLSNAGLQDAYPYVYSGSYSIGAPAFAGDAYAERTVVFPDAATEFRFEAFQDSIQSGVGSGSWLKAFIDNETVETMAVGQYKRGWKTYTINITGYETGNHTFRIESDYGPTTGGYGIGFYVDQLAVRIDPNAAPAVLLGDANDDGTVNQADTLRVLKQIVGLSSKPAADTELFTKTDVHQNGMIEVGDALYIAQYNVGLRNAWFALKG